ncbi:CYTH domain-containing protein [Paenibacillus medicaginis]|uniref:CYTH domain-containing protein n=1 Tax=Paenibacillus medicaginis TaxID=1470560 RepID=A0ABV5BZK2_9BACL
MSLEIERKFSIIRYPLDELKNGDLKLISTTHIEQAYLAYNNIEQVRIRKKTIFDDNNKKESFYQTYKKSTCEGLGLVRDEMEYEISSNIYSQLRSLDCRVPIRKTRTRMTGGGYTYDLDEYEQFNLIIAEVEFESIEEMRLFVQPAWLGDEISHNSQLTNKYLWKKLNGLT